MYENVSGLGLSPLPIDQEAPSQTQTPKFVSWLGKMLGYGDSSSNKAITDSIKQTTTWKFPNISSFVFFKPNELVLEVAPLSGRNIANIETTAAAKTLLKKIITRSSAIETETSLPLRVIQKREPTSESVIAKARYCFWAGTFIDNTRTTTDYIENLISTAYPNQGGAQDTLEALRGSRLGMAKANFSNYLAQNKNSITPSVLNNLIKDLDEAEQVTYQAVQISDSAIEALSGGVVEKLEETSSTLGFLQRKGITQSKKLGEGSFGVTFAVKVAGNSSDYVWKNEKKITLLSCSGSRTALHRVGPIAAARLASKGALPHHTRTVAFVFLVSRTTGKERYFVPVGEVKDFLAKIGKAKIGIEGQLMEHAQGKEMREELNSIKGEKYFNSFARQCFDFVEKSAERNFVHRDLKPENTFVQIVDPEKGILKATFFDPDLGEQLPKPHKRSAALFTGAKTTKSGHQFTSSEAAGTEWYMSPKVLKGSPHEAEVDYHSMAIMLLELLSPEEVPALVKRYQADPSADFYPSTQSYIARSSPKSNIASILNSKPEIKTTIDRFFAVANTNNWDARKAAIQDLKNHIATLT